MSVLGFLSKEARELAEALAKNSGATQVATTGGSYKKAGEILEREGVLGNVLDYGAGRGHGTQFLPGNAQSYEPNPKPDYFPDFTESPDATYDGIANLNVLNVVPEPIRQEIAQDILGKLNVDGVGVVGARSYNDVMNAKNPEFLDDGGIVTSRGTYQYGFGGENEGLVEYLQRQATENFPDREYDISPENIAATGALIKRLSSVAVPGTAGLLAAGQSEDADAGIIRQGVDDVARLMQIGMLKTDSDKARNTAIKKYDKLLSTNPAFAHREEMAGDNLFQTIRQQEEFDVPTLTMEDLKGYTLAPIRSDRSMIGTVDQVGGIEIPRVDVQGGFQFPMKHQGTGRGWGSGESVAQGQHSKMQAMGEATGQEVLGVINMMGPDSINFSTPIADIMHSQFAKLDKIPAADKLEFDTELRKAWPDWPGIDSPESVNWLRGGGDYENVGKKRTSYTTIMRKAKYRDKGFPNYEEAVEAASHTGLKDLAYGDSGMAIYKPDLTRDIYADDVHDSYSHIMPGEIVGRLEEPVPFAEMFSSNYGANRQRTSAAGEPYTHDQSIVASNIRKDGYEVADDEWYEGIFNYLNDKAPVATAAAVGTAGTVASDDADAAVALNFAKNVDIDSFVSQWRKRVSREPHISPQTHLQNITHDPSWMNYDEFGAFARKQDGGKNGPTYLGAMKDHLIALSRHPDVAKDNRLRKGLTEYANTRFAQRQNRQRGMADPGLLGATAAGSAAAAGFAPWPEYKDPNAPLPVPSFGEAMGNALDVLAMPMTGLQGIGRGLYGLATGEDLVTAGANAAHIMGSEYKDGGILMTPGMDSEKGATKLESWVTEKTGDPSLGWMAKMGLIFGGI